MSRKRYPFQCNACKSGVVLVETEAEMIFAQFNLKKYRVYMEGYGNMSHVQRYTLFSDKLSKVISYMQERSNALARRLHPEVIGVYIFEDKIDFDHCNMDVYSWTYKPTYRED